MPYINDVFISYKRGKVNEQWLNDIFLPFFENELDNILPTTPRIFVDKSGLTPGVDFENELFKNLIFSKCMVSIWSPPYFRKSEWCVMEYLTMRFKQDYHKLNAFTTPKTLLWPIMYRKVDPLPPAIQNITYLDYSDYNVVGEAFFKSEKFIKFQEKLQGDIKSIADIIISAPPYNAYWDTPQGRTEMLQLLKEYFDSNSDFEQPPAQTPITWSVK
jgi:hypothetical protein